MNPDFTDLLRAFSAADVRCLVVGAYAVSLHSRPRATGFEAAWTNRVSGSMGGVQCWFIGRAELIKNKRALGRPRDLLGETK